MKDKDILKYIDTLILNLNKPLTSGELKLNSSEEEKQKLRLEVVHEIKRAFEWGLAPEENKQSKRILKLAKLREQDLDVTIQLHEIKLYSKIREVVPYIMAVSYKINTENKYLTEDLLNFCEKQLNIIDSTGYRRGIAFPYLKEIEIAFKSYIERIKPNKIPSLKVYNQPEVNDKIEELYQMFLTLSKLN